MGAAGATVSSETADAVITVDRVDRVADAVHTGRRALHIARQSVLAGMGLSIAAMAVAARRLPTAGRRRAVPGGHRPRRDPQRAARPARLTPPTHPATARDRPSSAPQTQVFSVSASTTTASSSDTSNTGSSSSTSVSTGRWLASAASRCVRGARAGQGRCDLTCPGHDVIVARHRAGYVRETPHSGSAEGAAPGLPEAMGRRFAVRVKAPALEADHARTQDDREPARDPQQVAKRRCALGEEGVACGRPRPAAG